MRRLRPLAALGVVLTMMVSGLVASVAQAPPAAAATCSANASIYGVLSDGRLTYTSINPANGNRILTVVASTSLGFTPKAMATLNFNTLLVTHPTTGALWRVDIGTNNASSGLTFTKRELFSSGWTHDKLTYDGHGHLYGTAKGTLLQYLVSQDKPSGSAHIGQRREVGTGFTLATLATSGDDTLYATTSSGALLEYTVTNSSWIRAEIRSSGWGGIRQLASPHGGLIYGVNGGAMYWYEHAGSTLRGHGSDPVDTSGWNQTTLSAVPASACATGSPGFRPAPLPNPHSPSRNSAGWTPSAAHVKQEIDRVFPDLRACSGATRPGSGSDHNVGNAIDCMGGRLNVLPSASEEAVMTELSWWLKRHATSLKLKYVIWQDRIWFPGDGASDRGSCQHGCSQAEIREYHWDHVHISVK